MRIIGITGLKRSGKNTAGNIAAELVPNVKLVAFADKLKIAGARALGFDRPEQELIDLMDSFKEAGNISVLYHEPGDIVHPYEDKASLHSLSGREYLQFLGTEGGRKTFGDSFWTDLVLPDPGKLIGGDAPNWRDFIEEELDERYPGVETLIVTDVRFDNEAQRVKDTGGEVWEVIGGQSIPSSDGHASEAGVAPELVDVSILNHEGLDELREYVAEALGC